MNKIEIKDTNGNVIFIYEKENNTIKDTIEEAVKNGVSLANADLKDTDLRGANLSGANLSHAYFKWTNLSDANLSGSDLSNAIFNKANISNADLRGANLSCAHLSHADISNTNLRGADLRYAILECANFKCAILSDAILYCADLKCADLKCANLIDANLSGAYLVYADLKGADLNGVDLSGVNLSHTKNIPDDIPMACPKSGSFIGWKKVIETRYCYKYEYYVISTYLIKLEIPADAKRCSATSKKCRCDKAKVLKITNIKTNRSVKEVTNHNFVNCTYRVGEMVYPDSFDDNRWNECSNGIHFFMDKKDAIDY